MDFPIEFDRCPEGLHYRGALRIDAAPPPKSPLAYCEDGLVGVVTDIYKHFVKVGYLPAGDVIFPSEHLPRGRHTFDTSLYRDEFNMSPRVISLLERLPYVDNVKPSRDIEWYPSALLIDYRNPETARRARDVGHISYWASGDRNQIFPDLSFMRPGDVALATPAMAKTQHMILDTEANSIRFMYGLLELPEAIRRDQLEVPDEESHYRNFPGYHATSVLKTFYQDLISLRIVPIATWNDTMRVEHDNAAFITARIMRECFGWPDNFRQQSWVERVKDVEREAENVKDRLESNATRLGNGPLGSNYGELFSEDKMKQATEEALLALGLHELQVQGS